MAEKLGLFEKKNWKFALFLVPVFSSIITVKSHGLQINPFGYYYSDMLVH